MILPTARVAGRIRRKRATNGKGTTSVVPQAQIIAAASAAEVCSPSEQKLQSHLNHARPASAKAGVTGLTKAVTDTFTKLGIDPPLGSAGSGFHACRGAAHVAGGDGPFFAEVQRCYEAWMPGTPKGRVASRSSRRSLPPGARSSTIW